MAVLYSNLKFLRFQDRLAAFQRREVLAPVHIRIKPTNRCNHDCWYCAYKVDNLQLGEEMVEADTIPPEKMAEIVEDIIGMGVQAVTFSGGGEPLLYKTLPETITRLAEGGVRVATLTNGANLKGRMADVLARHAVWVRISIDAWDNASYCKARNLKGDAFSQLLRNMRAFTARDTRCVLGVSFIITEENYEYLVDACTTFKEAGVNHVKLSGVVVDNAGDQNNQYHDRFMEQVTAKIHEAETLTDAHFTIINHYHALEERFNKPYTLCPFLQWLTVIGADSKVYACQDKTYTPSGLLGSIQDQSFKTFWFSEENRRRLFALNPARVCRHHCVTHSKNLAIYDFLDLDPDHSVFV
jgi:sulfatase maturation enzyme AslB (radical SAM superfamily)